MSNQHAACSRAASNANSFLSTFLASQIKPEDLLRAIRLPEVLRMSGESKSSLYAKLNPRDPSYDPLAPKPFKLGNSERSSSAWWAWEVLAYLQAKSDMRNAG